MKKTLTVNLNNIVFNIDDDAYDLLQAYLSDVEKHLSANERTEVMADIEARIAELFGERLLKNKNVLNSDDVEQIIAVMGKPNQYSTDDDDDTQTLGDTDYKKHSRRFYRDPETKILGGVCSGIAAYLGWDVTWVRILFVLLVIFGVGTVIPVYIVIWIVAPEANTVAQRLQMQGEDVTVDSIKSEFNNVRNYVQSDKVRSSAQTFGMRLGAVVRGLVKIVLGFVGAIFGFVGVILLGVLIITLIVLAFDPTVFTGFAPEMLNDWEIISPEKITLLIISLLLIVGCPIFMLIYWAVRIVTRRPSQSNKTTSLVVLTLWLAGIFMFYSVGAKTIIKLRKSNFDTMSFQWDDKDNGERMDENRTVEAFDALDISGNFDVDIFQDSSHSVIVNAPSGLLPKVKTEIEGKTLRVYTNNFQFNRPVKITIRVDSLVRIDAKGATKLNAEMLQQVDNFALSLTGASVANMHLDVKNNLTLDLTGAVKADLRGRTNNLKADVAGASQLNAYDLTADKVVANAIGASQIEIFVLETLTAKAVGASKVKYRGNPKNTTKNSHIGSSIEAN